MLAPRPNWDGSLPELPHSVYSEMEVLVSLLRNDGNWDLIVGEIGPEDFYDLFHRKVFQAMSYLANGGKRLGLASVFGQIAGNGRVS